MRKTYSKIETYLQFVLCFYIRNSNTGRLGFVIEKSVSTWIRDVY